MAFTIIRNDITRVKADAIVNTANPKPTYGSGVDQAIYEAAGKEKLLEVRKKIGDIARGQAVETPAFELNAKYIIHTVGPAWDGGDKGEYDILRSCYENSLKLALKLKCKSIAFPLIATGVYGFPKDKALQIALSAIQSFVMNHSMEVILVVFDKKAFELSGNVIENIREFVDSNYVESVHEKEYMTETDIMGNFMHNKEISIKRRRMAEELYEERQAAPRKSTVKISELLAAPEKTFQEKLFEIIDERGLTGPQVYKNYISKQVYSKIQANKYYHPNKFTAIALCLSLNLDLDDTQDLIGRAGWRLSQSNKADIVVSGCILNGEYNLVKINCILFDYDCDVLEKIK